MPERSFSSGNNYRYGFNGKEGENYKGEVNAYDYGARIYDPRLGRWMSVDPLQGKYPAIASYVYVANNPIIFIDPDGKKIKLSGTVKDQQKFVADLRLVTGLDIQLKNGELLLMVSEKPGPSFSPALRDIVISLLDEKGDHYSNNVVFNLVNKKNGFASKILEDKSITSKDVYFDQFVTGAYDMKDADALKKCDMMVYVSMLAHVLAERANIKNGDYEAFLKSIDKDPSEHTREEINQIETYFNNAHLYGVMAETKVLEQFYTDKQGNPIKLRLRLDKQLTLQEILKNMFEKEKTTTSEFDYGGIKIVVHNEKKKSREITCAEIIVKNPDIRNKVPEKIQ